MCYNGNKFSIHDLSIFGFDFSLRKIKWWKYFIDDIVIRIKIYFTFWRKTTRILILLGSQKLTPSKRRLQGIESFKKLKRLVLKLHLPKCKTHGIGFTSLQEK